MHLCQTMLFCVKELGPYVIHILQWLNSFFADGITLSLYKNDSTQHHGTTLVQCCGKSKILGHQTDHPWLMDGWSVSVLGGPSIIYWDHEMIKSIKGLVKIRQSVFTLYSDTTTNRHTDGFLQDCSISSALAMEILQSCIKPWIWYQCIYVVVCPLFFRNIFSKT